MSGIPNGWILRRSTDSSEISISSPIGGPGATYTQPNHHALPPRLLHALADALLGQDEAVAETMTLQEVWDAMGGNPGISPSKADVLLQLSLLDKICDEADDKAAPVGSGLSDDLIAKLSRIHRTLGKMQRAYGDVGSRDVDVAAWNHNLFETMRAIGRLLCELPLERLGRAALVQEPAAEPITEKQISDETLGRYGSDLKRSIGFAAGVRHAERVHGIVAVANGETS